MINDVIKDVQHRMHGALDALHREFKSSIFSWHWIDSEPGHSAVAKEAEQPNAR